MAPMEFWGVEVKPGESLKVEPGYLKLIQFTQAALGEVKDGDKPNAVPLRLNINNENFVLGTLSAESTRQLNFDLVFHKEFELSHDWKNGSVYFCGYCCDDPTDDSDIGEFSSAEEEDILGASANRKVEGAKPKATSGDPVLKPIGSSSDVSEDDSSDDKGLSDDESDELSADRDEDVDICGKEDVKKQDSKRPFPSASKTPLVAKIAKFDTPHKTGGKKGGHAVTPHPQKQSGKPLSNGQNSKKSPRERR